MTEVWVALIAGAFGALGVGIPAWVSMRRTPTRRTTDTISLVDASGTVIRNLSEEIDRLEELVAEARTEALACRSENRELRRRVARLEEALSAAGIDPAGIG